MPLLHPNLSEVDAGITTASKLVQRYGDNYQIFVDQLEREKTLAISREVARIRSAEPDIPTVASLEISLVKAARIVDRHGDRYLPIFLLIEAALIEAGAKRKIMDRVRECARRDK